MVRQRHRALIGLGSNLSGPLGNPRDYIATALTRLAAMDGIESLRASRLYRSAPWGNRAQNDFINAVSELATTLDPAELLGSLNSLEAELGRQRGEKWGPRLIDLDLLSYDALEVDGERLSLPHPRMHERAFVLIPLLELDPEFVIPGKGPAERCLEALGDEQRVTPL